jgi:hypothetical protein
MKHGANLEVTQDSNGQFFCVKKGDTGACIQGAGVSVLEAVGCWAVQSGFVQITCNPPAVLKEYMVDTRYEDLTFLEAPKRD